MLQLPFNLACATDSYKASHWLQFPKGTKKLFYYIESRSEGETIIPFGFQALVKEYLLTVPSLAQIEEAREFWNAHGFEGVFNYEGWKKVVNLGYLPLEIKAVPEGLPVPSKEVICTVVNTHDDFFWLPGWVETLLMQVWYPTTVATRSFKIKQIIKYYLEETGDIEGLPFKLHDFGFRGATTYQAAMLGGMAHLVNFMGTDTTAAIQGVWKYYDPDKKREMPAFSIPAAEHSTITSWGKDGEVDAYRNMLENFAKPDSFVAVVSDSYDLDNAIKNIWGNILKQEVINSGAVVILRPDSGDPKEVVMRTLYNLDKRYGSNLNRKGYKVLKYVRVIQGDGVSDPKVIAGILEELKINGFSADNIAFGMGAGLLQKLDRDTYKFAMKCSARFDGVGWYDVFKQPKDAPWKASKRGLMTLANIDGELKTIDPRDLSDPKCEVLRPIFKNGKLLVDEDFREIRERIGI